MDNSTLWWIATAVLVAVELHTTTFYLLMLALGTAAGALAAQGGWGLTVQLGVGTLVGAVALGLCHGWRRQRQDRLAEPTGGPQALLDIGQTVQVQAWSPDGLTRVEYRGSTWFAQLAPRPHGGSPSGSVLPLPGPYRIKAMQGTHLVLETLETPHD